MAVDFNGIVFNVLEALTTHVFGRMEFTTLFLMVVFFIFCVLIRIPVSVSFALPIPLAIVLIAYGLLPLAAGAVLVGSFLVMSVLSFLASMGVSN
jgi:hypothetical protein